MEACRVVIEQSNLLSCLSGIEASLCISVESGFVSCGIYRYTLDFLGINNPEYIEKILSCPRKNHSDMCLHFYHVFTGTSNFIVNIISQNKIFHN